MSDERLIVLPLSAIEIAQLAALVEHFVELVGETTAAEGDPAVERLTPDAYPTDPEAGEDFRRLTRDDLLGRRLDDAGVVLSSLAELGVGNDPAALDDNVATRTLVVALDGDRATAWMRTLTAVRLIRAARLGIVDDASRPPADPRYFLYEWLGATLESVIQAVSPAD